MLESLRIKNFALIAELEIKFNNNLNVLSGETGAGKSIIIDSLSFVLGERADKGQVREGESFTFVQAVFDISKNLRAQSALIDLGLEKEAEVIVSRKLNLDGKNEIRINGVQVNIAMLKQLTACLVDAYGQHEHQALLKPAAHIDFVDSWGGKRVQILLEELRTQIKELNEIEERIQSFGGSFQERERKKEFLEFQVRELTGAKLVKGEFDELTATKQKMQYTEKVVSAANSVLGILEGEANEGAIAGLYRAHKQIAPLTSVDSAFEGVYERLDAAQIELSDIADTIKTERDKYRFNDSEFERIDSRLDLLKELARKYGGSEEAALAYLAKAESELAEFNEVGEILRRLAIEKNEISNVINETCLKLSALRISLAADLEDRINPELKELGMKNAQFKVGFKMLEGFTQNGMDEVEFLFSANLGETLKPLCKVISGGEMSRFMLAFKIVVGAVDGISTLVFDEIDSGISGVIGQVVAVKMGKLSRICQVIAVSHLPQIAAMADAQFLIEKQAKDGKTQTYVRKLDSDARIQEVARLSGGLEKSLPSQQHAQELLENAKKLKTAF